MESSHKYEIILYWSKDDDAIIAEVPELPGCVSDGKSYLEALQNVETIIDEWIETARLEGRDMPFCQVPGSRFQVPGSRFQVPGSRFQVPGSRFQVPSSRFKVQDSSGRLKTAGC